jgi:hypothetical protein
LLGSLILDRSLFAAGEAVHFAGYAALGMRNGRVATLPAGSRMKVEPGDQQPGSHLLEVAVDSRGKFWGQFKLPANSGLGEKQLHASLIGRKQATMSPTTTWSPISGWPPSACQMWR